MDMDFIRRRITELRLAKGVSEVTMSKALRVLSIRIEKKVNYFYEVTTSD